MPTNVIPTVGPWVTPLQIPSDGEGISSASVLAYVQEIANRLELIRNRAPGLSAAGSPIRLMASPQDAYFETPTWNRSLVSPGTTPTIINASVSATNPILFPIKGLVPGQVIRSANLVVKGGAAHAALPAVMPACSLISVDMAAAIGGASDPSPATEMTANDASANTAAYQVNHAIQVTGAITVVTNRLYYIRTYGESGANALVGLRIMSASVEVSA